MPSPLVNVRLPTLTAEYRPHALTLVNVRLPTLTAEYRPHALTPG